MGLGASLIFEINVSIRIRKISEYCVFLTHMANKRNAKFETTINIVFLLLCVVF